MTRPYLSVGMKIFEVKSPKFNPICLSILPKCSLFNITLFLQLYDCLFLLINKVLIHFTNLNFVLDYLVPATFAYMNLYSCLCPYFVVLHC